MTEGAIPADRLVAVYRKIREQIDTLEIKHKEKVNELKEQLDIVEAALLDLCNQQGVDSLRTANGTATRGVRTRYGTTDWEAMYEFIGKHSAPYLLEQRIHAGNMNTFVEAYPDEELPTGLNKHSRYAITIRKPTSK